MFDKQSTGHAILILLGTAGQRRPTQLRLFDSEVERRRLRLSMPPSYLEASSRPMERETVDPSTMPISRLFV